MIINFDHLQVRVNLTCRATILELTDTSAVVRMRSALATNRQTTVVITDVNGAQLYLPGRIVRSRPQTGGPGCTRQEHHIVVEFFGLSGETQATLQHLIASRILGA